MDDFTVGNTANLLEQLGVTFRSVSQLNMAIKQKLKSDPQLGRSFSVVGELSNVNFNGNNIFFQS